MLRALDPTFDRTSHVETWGGTVIMLLESFADANKPIKESAIPENPQSAFDWLSKCWNPHENFSHPGGTHSNLVSSISGPCLHLGGGCRGERGNG